MQCDVTKSALQGLMGVKMTDEVYMVTAVSSFIEQVGTCSMIYYYPSTPSQFH